MARRFKVGDEVMLVKPFRCDEDERDEDEEFDELIRRHGNKGVVRGFWREGHPDEGYSIRWEGAGNLVCNEDVVGLIQPPLTPEEEAAFLAETFGI